MVRKNVAAKYMQIVRHAEKSRRVCSGMNHRLSATVSQLHASLTNDH